MELIGFIVLLVLGIAAIIFDRLEILKYLYIPLLFSFMVIVRLNAFVFNAFEIDIITYGLEMKAYSFDIYYLREFVFWFGIRILYFITQSFHMYRVCPLFVGHSQHINIWIYSI